MKQKSPFSKLLGSSLAHIQSLADDVFHYGFKKLKELGKDQPVVRGALEEEPHDHLVHFMKRVVRFLGDSGETYYDTYEKIKAKKAAKQAESRAARHEKGDFDKQQ